MADGNRTGRSGLGEFEVAPGRLRWRCDPASLNFECTDELGPPTGFIGQDRAVAAVEFGFGVDLPGYNVFVTGLTGTGRASTVRALLERVVEERAATDEEAHVYDVCYVYNFAQADHPNALRMRRGGGRAFVAAISGLHETLKREIGSAFTSDEYRGETAKTQQEFNGQRQEAMQAAERYASERGFAIQMSQIGMAVIPVADGQPLDQAQFMALPDEERAALEEGRRDVTGRVEATVRQVQEIGRSQGEALEALAQRVGELTVQAPFETLFATHGQDEDVTGFLNGLREYTLTHLDAFQTAEDHPGETDGAAAAFPPRPSRNPFLPFEVNLFIDHSGTTGPPIVVEAHPTYSNLFGRIDRRAEMGTYVTDHTMLRPGALIAASGGYLVMEARDVLVSPGAWDGLKRVLRSGEVQLEDPSEVMTFVMPHGIRPEPIPLHVKVILTGDAQLYQMLASADPDFWEIFKVRADFDSQMDATPEHVAAIGSFICGIVQENGLRHFRDTGVAGIVEHAARMVSERGKLSTRFGFIKDIIVQSSYWAEKAGANLVEREHVEEAIEQRVYRSGLVADRIRELMVKGTLLVDLEGERVGQVNGLAVYDLGDVAFGRPSRITARTYMGRQGVVNIEREARLSGSTHDKGVLILGGYLGAKYAQDHPLSVSVSLAFEHSYGGVDGDSASSTELYAILSSLSGLPIRQGIAVTGSVNQMGDIQPIGGANEKVEGFFDLCRAAGVGNGVGVMIPQQNVDSLALRPDVVRAVEAGDFHVYAVATIEEGIEVLTGAPAGAREPDGSYPADSVNALVDGRLAEMAEGMKAFLRGE